MVTQTASTRPAPAAPAKVARKRAASATPTPPRRKASPGTGLSAAPATSALPQAAPVKTPSTNKAGKPARAAKPDKADKPRRAEAEKKPKLVRDSFTMPKPEYEVIAALKLRAAKLGQAPKKSELLRAGIKALAALTDAALLASLAAVPAIKTGRPKA